MGEYFWGLSGRMNRLQWWLGQGLILLILAATAVLFFSYHDGSGKFSKITSEDAFIMGGLLLLSTWINLISSVKRLHDLDSTGWWYLLYLTPFVGGIIMLVVLGFLAGTKGDNNYGSPDGNRSSGHSEYYGESMGMSNGVSSAVEEKIQVHKEMLQGGPGALGNAPARNAMSRKPAPRPLVNGGRATFGQRTR